VGVTIIRDARVLTLDEVDSEHPRADIVIDGEQIVAVGQDAGEAYGGQAAVVIDATGMLAMPGLVNAHLHSPGNFLKAAIPNLPLELFMLYEVPPFMPHPVSARYAYLRTVWGAVEMLKQGVTAVHDDAFFLPGVTEAETDSVMAAYTDSGIRAAVTLDQPNVVEYTKYPYLEGLLPPGIRARMEATTAVPEEELLSAYADFIGRWGTCHERRVGTAVSCSAPQRVTPSYLQALSELSARHDIPHNMHILETRLQRVFGEEVLGRSLVRYVDELGVLDERAMVIHAIWIDDHDIELLAGSGCSVAHNPVSNLKLGSGVMRWRALHEAGVPIALGTDEATVDDGINVWTVLKTAGLIHNIADPDPERWPTASEILRAATAGGARAMRLGERTGRLSEGYAADIVLIDTDSLAFTPLGEVRRQLVYCEPRAAVDTTIVAGEVLMAGGELVGFDEAALRAEVRECAAELASYLEGTRAGVAELEPYYREMYRRSLEHPIGMSRWVGGAS
jgi:cytosine/adenosine deaminase-related metal-dependent hydrolase